LKYELGSYIILLTADKKSEGNTIILGRGKGKRSVVEWPTRTLLQCIFKSERSFGFVLFGTYAR